MKIDDKYKWVARDKNGKLFAFENKPKKMKILWTDKKMPEIRIEETDERFYFIRWHDDNPVRISEIGNILALDEKEDYPSGNKYNPLGISVEEAMKMIDKRNPDNPNDIISKPSHYIGINGLEVEQILAEFLPKIEDSYVAHRVGSAIEYLLRSSSKNGDEDIKKAGQNIEQIIKYKQSKQA